jgi:hypothetical protein
MAHNPNDTPANHSPKHHSQKHPVPGTSTHNLKLRNRAFAGCASGNSALSALAATTRPTPCPEHPLAACKQPHASEQGQQQPEGHRGHGCAIVQAQHSMPYSHPPHMWHWQSPTAAVRAAVQHARPLPCTHEEPRPVAATLLPLLPPSTHSGLGGAHTHINNKSSTSNDFAPQHLHVVTSLINPGRSHGRPGYGT